MNYRWDNWGKTESCNRVLARHSTIRRWPLTLSMQWWWKRIPLDHLRRKKFITFILISNVLVVAKRVFIVELSIFVYMFVFVYHQKYWSRCIGCSYESVPLLILYKLYWGSWTVRVGASNICCLQCSFTILFDNKVELFVIFGASNICYLQCLFTILFDNKVELFVIFGVSNICCLQCLFTILLDNKVELFVIFGASYICCLLCFFTILFDSDNTS